jgi:hypothetical protein
MDSKKAEKCIWLVKERGEPDLGRHRSRSAGQRERRRERERERERALGSLFSKKENKKEIKEKN